MIGDAETETPSNLATPTRTVQSWGVVKRRRTGGSVVVISSSRPTTHGPRTAYDHRKHTTVDEWRSEATARARAPDCCNTRRRRWLYVRACVWVAITRTWNNNRRPSLSQSLHRLRNVSYIRIGHCCDFFSSYLNNRQFSLNISDYLVNKNKTQQ